MACHDTNLDVFADLNSTHFEEANGYVWWVQLGDSGVRSGVPNKKMGRGVGVGGGVGVELRRGESCSPQMPRSLGCAMQRWSTRLFASYMSMGKSLTESHMKLEWKIICLMNLVSIPSVRCRSMRDILRNPFALCLGQSNLSELFMLKMAIGRIAGMPICRRPPILPRARNSLVVELEYPGRPNQEP